ncbi:MAG: AAA family ATPase [Pseudomonadota bacterium]
MALTVEIEKQLYDFNEVRDISSFSNPGFSIAIYKADIEKLWDERISGQIVDTNGNVQNVSLKIYQWCQYRLLKLQVALSQYFLNFENHIEMMIACAIAQEPILFIGPPGVAKTELAISFFGGIGLRRPTADSKEKQNDSKYFEYLLSPYTVPEELFGLLDIDKLKDGEVTRINQNMITGKHVRGVFLDEVFNASSNILNTLLTLINERRYFDKGMFQPADLKILIGASNDTPVGKYGSGQGFAGKKSAELRAFYDRFTIRLYFPTPQELSPTNEALIKDNYKKILEISQERTMEKLTMERPQEFRQIACINDILLLGRLIGHRNMKLPEEIQELALSVISGLSLKRSVKELCTMSPRKANKVIPMICASSFLIPPENLRTNRNGNFSTEELIKYVNKDTYPKVSEKNLTAFYHIWDFEKDRGQLENEVNTLLEQMQ